GAEAEDPRADRPALSFGGGLDGPRGKAAAVGLRRRLRGLPPPGESMRASSQTVDRLAFVLLNAVIVWLVLAMTFGAAPEYLAYYGVALAIVTVQSVLFFRFTRWVPRLVVLYLGFAFFCWTLTLSDVWAKREQLASLGGLVGLVLRGFAFVVFAH